MNRTVCPTGFVVPSSPGNIGIEFVDLAITDCAFSCVNHPRYLPSEYDIIFAVRLGSICFSCIMSFIAVYLWMMDRKHIVNNFFVILYGCVMFVGSLTLALVFTPGRAKRFCEDTATPIYENPQPTCSAEGFAMLCSLTVMCFCWCFQSYEVFNAVVRRAGKRAEQPKSCAYLPWIIGPPFVCSMVLSIAGSFVYKMGKINCDLWAKHPELEFVFGWIPIIIVLFFGIGFTLSVAVKILSLYKSRLDDGNSNIWTVIKLFSSALKYMFAFGIYLGSFLLVAIASGNGGNTTDEDFDRIWGKCVFEHYDGVSDESFRSICGDTPQRNVSFSVLCFFQFYQFGMHGVFFVGVHWDRLLTLYYRGCWPRWYNAQVKPYDVGELPVSASSAMPDDEDKFAGLKSRSPAPRSDDDSKVSDMAASTEPATVPLSQKGKLSTSSTIKDEVLVKKTDESASV